MSILLTCPKLPKHLSAAEVEAVLAYAALEGERATIAQAVLNEVNREPLAFPPIRRPPIASLPNGYGHD